MMPVFKRAVSIFAACCAVSATAVADGVYINGKPPVPGLGDVLQKDNRATRDIDMGGKTISNLKPPSGTALSAAATVGYVNNVVTNAGTNGASNVNLLYVSNKVDGVSSELAAEGLQQVTIKGNATTNSIIIGTGTADGLYSFSQGESNNAGGYLSFAGGSHADATDDFSFVWSDKTQGYVLSGSGSGVIDGFYAKGANYGPQPTYRKSGYLIWYWGSGTWVVGAYPPDALTVYYYTFFGLHDGTVWTNGGGTIGSSPGPVTAYAVSTNYGSHADHTFNVSADNGFYFDGSSNLFVQGNNWKTIYDWTVANSSGVATVFANTDHWSTAWSWGDHATSGYAMDTNLVYVSNKVDSVSNELAAEGLQQVTDRGNATTNSIIIGTGTADGLYSFSQGDSNNASGYLSSAFGSYAYATDDFSFVWADKTDGYVLSGAGSGAIDGFYAKWIGPGSQIAYIKDGYIIGEYLGGIWIIADWPVVDDVVVYYFTTSAVHNGSVWTNGHGAIGASPGPTTAYAAVTNYGSHADHTFNVSADNGFYFDGSSNLFVQGNNWKPIYDWTVANSSSVATVFANTDHWSTAWSWGDHATSGYAMDANLVVISNLADAAAGYTNDAYQAHSWGDHATNGYATTGEVVAVSNAAKAYADQVTSTNWSGFQASGNVDMGGHSITNVGTNSIEFFGGVKLGAVSGNLAVMNGTNQYPLYTDGGHVPPGKSGDGITIVSSGNSLSVAPWIPHNLIMDWWFSDISTFTWGRDFLDGLGFQMNQSQGKYLDGNKSANWKWDATGAGGYSSYIYNPPIPGSAALYFNGSAYLNAGTNNLPWGNAAISVFYWMYWDSSGGDQIPFGYGNNQGGQYFCTFIWTTYHLGISDLKNGAFGTLIPSAGAWHYVGVTYASNATSVKIYLDGTNQTVSLEGGPRVLTTRQGNNNLIQIGCGNDGNHRMGFAPYIGRMQDIQVWNTDIPESLVLSNFNSGAGRPGIADGNTVALWHMNEGTGNFIADASGNHNDATNFGAVWTNGWVVSGGGGGGESSNAVLVTTNKLFNTPCSNAWITILTYGPVTNVADVSAGIYDGDTGTTNWGTPISLLDTTVLLTWDLSVWQSECTNMVPGTNWAGVMVVSTNNTNIAICGFSAALGQ